MVAGTSSGVGKTTVATGLMVALGDCGHRVASAKVGPDFIDPGYHSLATGRPGRNLDAWMSGADLIAGLAARAAAGSDILVVEGVMGLFDGAGSGAEASTAHVARLLDAPVLLVVDASAMSGSIAALVHGFASWDPDVAVAGIILNQVGSAGHETLLREALEPVGVPVLGSLVRDDELTWRDRHLGLVPVTEHPDDVRAGLARLGERITQGCDLEAIYALAAAAPSSYVEAPPEARPVGRCRIAVAQGPAFSFMYPDNLELLEQAGAELIPFDPLEADRLPHGVAGLVAGGGFPEVFAPALADNVPLLDNVRTAVGNGLVTWAECGGLLWLCRSLDGRPMCGAIDAEGSMTGRLSLGYRTATFIVDNPLGPAGTTVRGHEFHYSSVDPPGHAVDLSGRFGAGKAGFAGETLLAAYLHLHLSAYPRLAEALVRTATAAAAIAAEHRTNA